jgi:hypothetical protein
VIDLRAITIVSGAQTGADRAALDFAIANGIPHGGWCPRGRLAEDGPIDEQYELCETPSRRYAQRTEWNIRDSDATVVFSMSWQVSGGTALTLVLAEQLAKPVLQLAHDAPEDATGHARRLLDFLAEHRVGTLNVAGPRASQESAVADFVHAVLTAALDLSDSTE